jgi:hypothetical protein
MFQSQLHILKHAFKFLTFIRYGRQNGQFSGYLLDAPNFENATAAGQNCFPQDEKQLFEKLEGYPRYFQLGWRTFFIG